MSAIYKREVKSYFTSGMGYAMIGIFLLVMGLFFWGNNLKGQNGSVGATLYSISVVLVFLLPLLTMRLFAEEQRQKTDQLLFSAPITIWDIILGKYFAVVTVFTVPVLVACTMPLVLSQFASGTYPFLENYFAILAFWFMGCVMLALGSLISALTESQIIACFATMCCSFIFWLMTSISSIISSTAIASLIGLALLIALAAILLFVFSGYNYIVTGIGFVVAEIALFIVYQVRGAMFESLFNSILSSISVFSRFYDFVSGNFNIGSIIYFVSVIFLFLYLTMQAIQKRRWS